jgi:serine protease
MWANVATASRQSLGIVRACAGVVAAVPVALLVLGLSGCGDEAPIRLQPAQRAMTGQPSVEAIVPGHVLVELRRGVQLTAQPSDGTPLALTNAAVVVGGERLRLLRELAPEPDPASTLWQVSRQAGAIVLLEQPDADEEATRRLVYQVATDAKVQRAEPDRIRHATAIPNDTQWSKQWSLPLIHMPRAWDVTHGSEDVTVAVLDTGIVHGHPDLEPRIVAGYDFISRPESADDGDRVRDPDPTDTGSIDSNRLHGTHVAGIIGAVTGNALGIAGVDQKCRVMPVRVLGVRSGDGIDSDISDALRWTGGAKLGTIPVVSRRIDVVNLSFGGPGISFTLQRAIDEIIAQGVLVVAAAGNGGTDATSYSPGGLDSVITVGAADEKGRRAVYSNYGPRVDVLAPGGGLSELDYEPDMMSLAPEGILSTYRDEGIDEPARPPFTYSPLVGTSQATPHLAGAAALARALLPGLRQRTFGLLARTSADARYRCLQDELGGCGAGLLDVESLLLLTQLQKRCSCEGDLYCVDGRCMSPPLVHTSIWDTPVVKGGFCELSSVTTPDASSRKLAVWWLGLGVLVLLGLFRLKARPQA